MTKPRVVTVVGTRPEIIRLSRLIPELDSTFDHTLVNTGQNSMPELNAVFFDDLELRAPDVWLETSSKTFYSAIGQILTNVGQVLESIKPDAFLVLGDTNSAISTLIAKRLAIPTYHMEAGNRSFDENVPEEINRRLVDHVADFNLPYNRHSENNLLREGLHPRFIFRTGSPMREVIDHYHPKIQASKILDSLGLKSQDYIVASIHRQENVDSSSRLKVVLDALSAVAKNTRKLVLVSTHPRTRGKIESEASLDSFPGLRFHEPFAFTDYMQLQINSFCVVSDSGTISEESAMMGFPAVTLRNSMERPEAMETGQILMSLANGDDLLRSIESAVALIREVPEGYSNSEFSKKVSRFVLSTHNLAGVWKNLS